MVKKLRNFFMIWKVEAKLAVAICTYFGWKLNAEFQSYLSKYMQHFPYTTLQYTDKYIFLHTYKEVHAVDMCVLVFGYLTLCVSC